MPEHDDIDAAAHDACLEHMETQPFTRLWKSPTSEIGSAVRTAFENGFRAGASFGVDKAASVYRSMVEQVRRVLLWNAHRKGELSHPLFWEEFERLVELYDETYKSHEEYT